MERLTQGDLCTLLKCLHEIYTYRDLGTFPAQLLSTLPQVVPSETTAYNEVNLRRRRIIGVMDPPEVKFPESEQVFARHIHEHPLVVSYQRAHDGRAQKISDFLTQRQFHRLGLYNELYRQMSAEHQMAITLSPAQPSFIALTLNRSRRDFSERDRPLLNLLRPHLIQAYYNAEAVTQMQQKLAGLERALYELDYGVIVLSEKQRVREMTDRARQWVTDYCGKFPRHSQRLPVMLQQWVVSQQELLAQDDEVLPPREPLVIKREGKQLVVRLLSGPTENHCMLLLHEERTALTAASLATLGLSQREAEALLWVIQGKTNPEIAVILTLSPRTVQTYLRRIYQKLGVETRTAATTQALETLGLLKR